MGDGQGPPPPDTSPGRPGPGHTPAAAAAPPEPLPAGAKIPEGAVGEGAGLQPERPPPTLSPVPSSLCIEQTDPEHLPLPPAQASASSGGGSSLVPTLPPWGHCVNLGETREGRLSLQGWGEEMSQSSRCELGRDTQGAPMYSGTPASSIVPLHPAACPQGPLSSHPCPRVSRLAQELGLQRVQACFPPTPAAIHSLCAFKKVSVTLWASVSAPVKVESGPR